MKVWAKFLEPLDPVTGDRLLDAIIFNCTLPPSPKQAQELIPQILGIDFDTEIKQAISAYHGNDRQAQLKIQPQIMEAIRASGGIVKFLNATEKQFAELIEKYSAHRLTQESTHADSSRTLPAVSDQDRTQGTRSLSPFA